MTFLEGVNRLLRIATVISGDDDELISFVETQHRASMELAKIAIQSTLNELVAARLFPYEEVDGNITYVQGQRLYDLPPDFVRFKGEPFLLEVADNGDSENIFVTEYRGGEDKLRQQILDYRDQTGRPFWFYAAGGTTKQIGLYPVPDSNSDGQTVRFPYERNVAVTLATDDLPFVDEIQANAFIDMAQRRFELLYSRRDGDQLANLQGDPIYESSRSTLMELMRFTRPDNRYGYHYA